MEMLDSCMSITLLKVVWRYAMMECGEQCVAMDGMNLMHQWCAGN